MKVGKLRTGLILIALGLILLLNTTGVWAWSIWEGIWRLWPVLLIAIGIEKIFGATTNLKPLAFLSPLLIIAGLAWVAIAGPHGGWNSGWGSGWAVNWDTGSDWDDEIESSWSAAAQGVTSARLRIDFGGGRLRLRGGAEDGHLLDGEFLSHGKKPRTTTSVVDDVATVALKQRGTRHWGPGDRSHSKWTCRLADGIPYDIDIDGGAARMDVDLVDVEVRRLVVDVGAADVDVTLGQTANEVEIDVTGGAAKVSLNLPFDAGVRVERDLALSSLNVSDFTLHETNGYMQSEGYDQATTRFDIRLSGGVASFRISGHGHKGASSI